MTLTRQQIDNELGSSLEGSPKYTGRETKPLHEDLDYIEVIMQDGDYSYLLELLSRNAADFASMDGSAISWEGSYTATENTTTMAPEGTSLVDSYTASAVKSRPPWGTGTIMTEAERATTTPEGSYTATEKTTMAPEGTSLVDRYTASAVKSRPPWGTGMIMTEAATQLGRSRRPGYKKADGRKRRVVVTSTKVFIYEQH